MRHGAGVRDSVPVYFDLKCCDKKKNSAEIKDTVTPLIKSELSHM